MNLRYRVMEPQSCQAATGPNFARPTTTAFPEGHLKSDRRFAAPLWSPRRAQQPACFPINLRWLPDRRQK